DNNEYTNENNESLLSINKTSSSQNKNILLFFSGNNKENLSPSLSTKKNLQLISLLSSENINLPFPSSFFLDKNKGKIQLLLGYPLESSNKSLLQILSFSQMIKVQR
ncbi:1549_t:CDS:1, partial [Dentiscutata heterogama]